MNEGKDFAAEGVISILNVGTKLLVKDVMDQYLRTLGDFKTYYAPNMASALRTFAENTIHILITEVDFTDGNVYRLIQQLGGPTVPGEDDLFVVLAIEGRDEKLNALASELEVHSVLAKPFAAVDLKQQIEKFRAWKSVPRQPWEVLLQEAHLALREKKFREAEQHFKDAVVAAPQNPLPLYKAGMYFLKKPDYAVAETLLKKAVEVKPNFAQGLAALAQLYMTKKDLPKAEEYLMKAQVASPLNPDRPVEMVRLYVDRCIESCRAGLRMDGANLALRVSLGKLLTFQKDYAGAVRELEGALPELRDAMRLEAQTFAALSRKLGGLAKT